MDGAGDQLGWTIDGLAAATLGAAVGACLLLLGQAPAGIALAAVVSLVALAALRQVRPEPRRFHLPAFRLETEGLSELLLTQRAPADELLLTDALAEVAPESRVVQLFAARPLPTPGELQQRIEAHLAADERVTADDGNVLMLEVDAAAALRQSLRELRRSLG